MSSKSRPRQRRSVARLATAVVAAVATVVAVAACGASVTGAPQPNTAAVATSAPTTSTSSTSTATGSTTARTSTTSTRTSISRPTVPTELTELTGLSDATDLTDLSIPTDIGSIPGFSPECTAVSVAYLAIAFAPLSALGGTGGSGGQFDDAELQKALADLNATNEIPSELAGDFQTLSQLSSQAAGGNLEQAGELFSSPEFTTASDHVSKWLEANCGG